MPQFLPRVVTATFCFMVGAQATAWANEEVYRKTLPAAVWIKTEVDPLKVGYGSGVLVDAKRRWIITNYHVVEDRKVVSVFFPALGKATVPPLRRHYLAHEEKFAVTGRVLAREPTKDLAVVELDRLPTGAAAVPMATGHIRPGQDVHVVGNPTGSVLWVYTYGKVRQAYRKQWNVRMATGRLLSLNAQVIETSLAINSGDSGGPVVNNAGQLVAVVSSFQSSQRLVTTCIDVSEIRDLLEQVAKGRRDKAIKRLPDPDPLVLPPAINIPKLPAAKVKNVTPADQSRSIASLLRKSIFTGRWKREGDGVHRVDVARGRPPFVYIEDVVDSFRSMSVRRVWAIGKIFNGAPKGDFALQLLTASHTRKLGSWQMQKTQTGKYLAVFCCRLRADASYRELESAIAFVYAEARDMNAGLIVGAEAPSLELPGTSYTGADGSELRFLAGRIVGGRIGEDTIQGTWRRTGNVVTIRFRDGSAGQGVMHGGTINISIQNGAAERRFVLQRQQPKGN